jgi:hypothetical protein
MVNSNDAHYPIYKSLVTHTSWKCMSYEQWYVKKYYNVNEKLQKYIQATLKIPIIILLFILKLPLLQFFIQNLVKITITLMYV